MSISSEIVRLQGAKADIKTAIEGKGVTVPSSTKLDGYADLVDAIQQGTTPTGTINIISNGTYNVTDKATARVTVPNTYTSSDEGKVVSNGALVAQGSDTVTTNGTVDTTLINSLTVNVQGSGGLNYDIKTVEVTNNSPTVDRAFDNFVFIAQIDSADIPAAADRARLKAYYLSFEYVNGSFISTTGSRGFPVLTNTAGSADFYGGTTNASNTVVGDTSIKFSTYSSQNMQAGTWTVVQIELPDNAVYPFSEV